MAYWGGSQPRGALRSPAFRSDIEAQVAPATAQAQSKSDDYCESDPNDEPERGAGVRVGRLRSPSPRSPAISRHFLPESAPTAHQPEPEDDSDPDDQPEDEDAEDDDSDRDDEPGPDDAQDLQDEPEPEDAETDPILPYPAISCHFPRESDPSAHQPGPEDDSKSDDQSEPEEQLRSGNEDAEHAGSNPDDNPKPEDGLGAPHPAISRHLPRPPALRFFRRRRPGRSQQNLKEQEPALHVRGDQKILFDVFPAVAS